MRDKKNPKELPSDALIDYDEQGVPVSRNLEKEADKEVRPHGDGLISNRNQQKFESPQNSGSTDRSHSDRANIKKGQGTEDAQKRSDTGTGL